MSRHVPTLLCLLIAIAPLVRADVSLPALFSDRMVLQRDLPCAIFGSGNVGDTVTITLKNAAGSIVQSKQTPVAANSRWQVKLDPTAAGGPYTLVIAAGGASHEIKDVLFGEVWLMSGQSNMANPVGKKEYAPLVEGDNFPLIRSFQQRSGWTKAETFNIQFIYAQAYFFARAIHRAEEQKIPVGLYSAAYVNSAIHEWMDPLTLAEHPESAAKPGAARHYTNLVRPAMGYTFRGMIWDQGENNGGLEADSAQYGQWLRSLISHWRTLSGNPGLIVIIPQLPTIRDQWRKAQDGPVATGGNDRTTRIRQGQFSALALPDTYLVTTWDTSDGDIHPRNALAKGERAARVYQHRVMGRSDVLPQGPIFERQEIQGGKLILHFRHTGEGLALDPKIPTTLQAGANPATELLGMAIAGADGQFHWAKAEIGKSHLTLTSPAVPAPTQARYTWADDLIQLGNLVNSAGLPAPTFRSDFIVKEQAPASPAPLSPVPPADGIYEGELSDFFERNLGGSLDYKIALSGGAYLSGNGKTFSIECTEVHATGPQTLTLRYRSKGTTALLRIQGSDSPNAIVLPDTGGTFANITVESVPLRKGANRLKLLSAPDSANSLDLDAIAIGNPNAFNTLVAPAK